MVDVTFNLPDRTSHWTIRTESDVRGLVVPDPRESMGYVLDAVKLARAELAGRTPLIGFAGAPFTVATYLVEGGGSKSFSAIKSLLFSAPAVAHELLGTCADTAGEYLAAQVEAGADAAMLFDTWAGLLSPADFDTFARPYVRRVLQRVQAAAARAGRVVPRIYYAGNAGGWIDSCLDIGADVIGLDWRLDLDRARRRLPGLTPGQSRWQSRSARGS